MGCYCLTKPRPFQPPPSAGSPSGEPSGSLFQVLKMTPRLTTRHVKCEKITMKEVREEVTPDTKSMVLL